jgi:hypothetical protein
MVLAHRLILSEKAITAGITVTTVIDEIVAATDFG